MRDYINNAESMRKNDRMFITRNGPVGISLRLIIEKPTGTPLRKFI